MFNMLLRLGAINAGLAVILGAFGAHGLRDRLPADLLAVYQTGVQYHMYHALGLILLGIVMENAPRAKWLARAGWLMILGIVLFSGSLYALAISGIRSLGIVTPFGGVAFIAAWGLFAWAAFAPGARDRSR